MAQPLLDPLGGPSPDRAIAGAALPTGPPNRAAQTAHLRHLRAVARGTPDDRATAAQHRRGKHTAYERMDLLFDDGVWHELAPLRRHRVHALSMNDRRPFGDGVVTGWGLIGGRQVFAYAHDARVFGGALGEAHAAKIQQVYDLALKTEAPVIALSDGAGARIQEGVLALHGYGEIFQRSCAASGVIPQISVILGACAGGAAYAPALADFIFVVRGQAQMFITGPDVIASVTGERVSAEELGGDRVHAERSGVASFAYDDEPACLEAVRELLEMLPASSRVPPPRAASLDPVTRRTPELGDLVPEDSTQAYDVRDVLEVVVDTDGDLLEVQQDWATNLVCALGRIDGAVVGFVASQPCSLAGTLDIDASDKGARFVQWCDAFNIPLVTLVDVPGFLPGVEQEHAGIIRHGAKLIYAYATATVPRIQVVLRKAYGGAYIVMDSPGLGCDLSLSWPGSEVAVMGGAGAAAIIFQREIAAATDPDAVRAECLERYRQEVSHPLFAAEHGMHDDVIDPAATRAVLAQGLAMLRDKRVAPPHRKHGISPV